MMNTVCEKDSCTGCMACKDICSKNAIEIKESIGSYNAIINEDKCIDCGACHRVCQVNQPVSLLKPKEWYQGWAKDDNVRKNSSSGGLAAAIESGFVLNGGEVCSCLFSDGRFHFQIARTLDEITKFSGSKYVKSDPAGCYKKVKKSLSEGKKVLFVGLPCQVAAVKKFAGDKLMSNLYTVDLICHGTPSPEVLRRFLKQYNVELSELNSISFRTKTAFHLEGNFKPLGMQGVTDKYLVAFLHSLCYTDNCYKCKYARLERVSDMTLGDSWGSDLPESEMKRGISLVLCQTDKGQELLNMSQLDLKKVDLERAVKHNQQLNAPSIRPEKRDYFLNEMKKGTPFNKIIFNCYPMSGIKQFIKACLIKIKLIGGAE